MRVYGLTGTIFLPPSVFAISVTSFWSSVPPLYQDNYTIWNEYDKNELVLQSARKTIYHKIIFIQLFSSSPAISSRLHT